MGYSAGLINSVSNACKPFSEGSPREDFDEDYSLCPGCDTDCYCEDFKKISREELCPECFWEKVQEIALDEGISTDMVQEIYAS